MKEFKKITATFCCPLCPYKACFPSWLTRHRLKHENAKQHACEICGSKFKTVSVLNMHKKLHQSEVYTCHICGFTCRLRKVLNVHMLVHEEKRIQCPESHYSCRRQEDLRKHIESMHQGKPRRKRYEEDVAIILTCMEVPFAREHVVKFDGAAYAPRRFARLDFSGAAQIQRGFSKSMNMRT